MVLFFFFLKGLLGGKDCLWKFLDGHCPFLVPGCVNVNFTSDF